MKRIFLISIISIFSQGLFGQSYNDSSQTEDIMDYESIVRELSKSSGTSRTSVYSPDPLAAVRFHVGVGFTNSLSSIEDSERGISLQAPLKGVAARFGIDLLSTEWRAEAGITTYESYDDKDTSSKIDLKEFDLSVVGITPVSRLWSYKIGMGLSARYLNLVQADAETQEIEYTTPAMSIQTGVIANVGPKFSISTDLHYRKSLIQETADKTALDFMVRLDGHF